MTPIFPARYLYDFVRYVGTRRDIVALNYDGLKFYGDTDYENAYPTEWRQFLEARHPDKIYLLIQYDVDADPWRTSHALRVHAMHGVPVSVMVFASPLKGSPIEYHEDLGHLRGNGAASVGYHCNAYDRTLHDLDAAKRLFAMDVEELRHVYGRVGFWSPHGGRADAEGRSNAHVLETPVELRDSLRWIHNRHGIRKNGQHSDGGILGEKYDVPRDLVKFVRGMKRGNRYRILLHPQYYGDNYESHSRLVGQGWYDEVIEMGGDVWGL